MIFILFPHSEHQKLLLLDHGIRNAADISKLNTIYVRGIGPKNIQTLFNCQRQMGNVFTFRPDYNVINEDIQLASNDIAAKNQHLKGEIGQEYKGMHCLRMNILAAVASTEHQYEDLAAKVYQAELNLEAFRKFN